MHPSEETPQATTNSTESATPVAEPTVTPAPPEEPTPTDTDVPVTAPPEADDTTDALPTSPDPSATESAAKAPKVAQSADITSPIFVSKRTTFPEILFSLGLASVFIVYASVIYTYPEAAKQIYLNNPLGNIVGHANFVIEASQFVNIFLAILVLSNRWKTTVYAFAGTWLLMIAIFRIASII